MLRWLLFAVVSIVMLWALIDAAIRPQAAYAYIGHNKLYWIIGLTLGFVFGMLPLIGIAALVAGIVYLVEYRPKLREFTYRRPNW